MLLFVVARPEIEWIVMDEILAEYSEVPARPKFGLPASLLASWRRFLRSATTRIELPRVVPLLRDRKDARFLACALAGSADFLIKGDRDFESARRLVCTTIVSVPTFEKHVCAVWDAR